MNTDRFNSRRSFLELLPLGVLAGVFASIGGAAFRFLRPRVMAASEQWLDVAAVSELSGPQPVAKKVLAEQVSGWAVTNEAHNVFVLPAKNNQVVSPICRMRVVKCYGSKRRIASRVRVTRVISPRTARKFPDQRLGVSTCARRDLEALVRKFASRVRSE